MTNKGKDKTNIFSIKGEIRMIETTGEKLMEDDLNNVSGGFGIRMDKKKKPEEPVAVTLATTNTTCPRCHFYGQMKFSGNQLTCTCGYSWSVFL